MIPNHYPNPTDIPYQEQLLAMLELPEQEFGLAQLVRLLSQRREHIKLAKRLVTRRYNRRRYTNPEKDILIQVLMLTAVELTDGKEPAPLTPEEEEAHYRRVERFKKRLHAAYQLLWAKVTQAPVNR